jgi:hypothetical protein
MSYTKQIKYQETCNYINPERDNAISMLKTCINDPNYKNDGLMDSIQNNLLPSKPNFLLPKNILFQKENTNDDLILKDGKKIEGFVAGDFNSDNGPGEQYIKVCPDEYKLENNVCVKKCDHCNTNYDASDYTDVCYPYNYDGIDNFGRIMCSTTKNINDKNIRISTQLSNINSKEELFSHHDKNSIYNINNYYL